MVSFSAFLPAGILRSYNREVGEFQEAVSWSFDRSDYKDTQTFTVTADV